MTKTQNPKQSLEHLKLGFGYDFPPEADQPMAEEF